MTEPRHWLDQAVLNENEARRSSTAAERDRTTAATYKAVRDAREALTRSIDFAQFAVLTDKQQGMVMADWLTQQAKIDARQMMALGNFLCQQADRMERENADT